MGYKKLYRTMFLMLVLLISAASTAFAAVVTATGQGSTERNALHDAMRTAIEQKVGTYIDSRTYVENYQVVNDRIYAQTEGYIQNYELLRSTQAPGGFWEVTIRAEVREEALRADLMTYVQKRAIIGANMQDPRIGVFAEGTDGQEDLAFENALISSLQSNGFTRLIDLKQIDASVKNRLASADAANDASLRNALISQFHVDYLVTARVDCSTIGLIPASGPAYGMDSDLLNALQVLWPDVNKMRRAEVAASVRMMNVNTGEILYAGSAAESGKGANGERAAMTAITDKLVRDLANSAIRKAANPEQHVTVLITNNALGSMTEAYQRISSIPGVSHVFTRSQSYGNMQVDVDYMGTAYDLATELEHSGIRIKEMNSEYIKI